MIYSLDYVMLNLLCPISEEIINAACSVWLDADFNFLYNAVESSRDLTTLG
jgi:hypothetical protein